MLVWAWEGRGVGCNVLLLVIRGRRLAVERTLLFRRLLVRGIYSLIRRTLRSLRLLLVGIPRVVCHLRGVVGMSTGTDRWQ